MPPADAPLRALAPTLAALAEAAPGREVCGLVVREPSGRLEAWPVPNAAPDPSRAFELDPRALLAAFRRLDAEGGAVAAVYHSHPQGGAGLSPADIAGALVGGTPLLPGAEQVVIALEGGRAALIRAYRPVGGAFEGCDLWRAAPCLPADPAGTPSR